MLTRAIWEAPSKIHPILYHYCCYLPASVAHLDERPTGDQEIAGSTPAGLAKSFMEIDHEIFSTYFLNHSLPSADSRRAVVSFWQKNVHNTG